MSTVQECSINCGLISLQSTNLKFTVYTYYTYNCMGMGGVFIDPDRGVGSS